MGTICLRIAVARSYARIAQNPRASVMMRAGLEAASMTHMIKHANALLTWVFARLARSQCSLQGKSALIVGQRKTRLATALRPSASASPQPRFQRQVRAKRFALHAQNQRASVTRGAGQAKVSMRHVITLANALPSWVSAKLARNQSTRLDRSAHHAGQQRTRLATALQQLVSASPQRSCPQQVRALSCAQNARTPHASASPSLVFARRGRNLCTLMAKSAPLAGQRRTRRACVSRPSVFATRTRR